MVEPWGEVQSFILVEGLKIEFFGIDGAVWCKFLVDLVYTLQTYGWTKLIA